MTNAHGTYWNTLVFQEPPSTMKLHLSLYSPGDLIPETRLRIQHPKVIIRHRGMSMESSAGPSCSTETLKEWKHRWKTTAYLLLSFQFCTYCFSCCIFVTYIHCISSSLWRQQPVIIQCSQSTQVQSQGFHKLLVPESFLTVDNWCFLASKGFNSVTDRL